MTDWQNIGAGWYHRALKVGEVIPYYERRPAPWWRFWNRAPTHHLRSLKVEGIEPTRGDGGCMYWGSFVND